MTDDRHDGRVVGQPLGDADGDVGATRVIHDPQGERPAPDPAMGIDLGHRQFSGMPHGDAARLGKGPGNAKDDRATGDCSPALASTGASGEREKSREDDKPGHERARLSLQMG